MHFFIGKHNLESIMCDSNFVPHSINHRFDHFHQIVTDSNIIIEVLVGKHAPKYIRGILCIIAGHMKLFLCTELVSVQLFKFVEDELSQCLNTIVIVLCGVYSMGT